MNRENAQEQALSSKSTGGSGSTIGVLSLAFGVWLIILYSRYGENNPSAGGACKVDQLSQLMLGISIMYFTNCALMCFSLVGSVVDSLMDENKIYMGAWCLPCQLCIALAAFAMNIAATVITWSSDCQDSDLELIDQMKVFTITYWAITGLGCAVAICAICCACVIIGCVGTILVATN
eukprot:gb/GECH01014606.1/.p1 GENE.gb/GECH01014606.1/~~gb/GECH01014606.1/.p1  ORF type:complete len:178 (+),score=24.86 gb/GECH01014606.1/:1-534(+)